MANLAKIWPVIAKITQEFGTNPSSIQPNGHTGRDYGVPIGTPVKAIADGVVIYADWANKLAAGNIWWIAKDFAGIVVLVDHGGLVSVYAHLNETPLNPGDKVVQGQVIGKSGTTGLSTGPHLHFEVFTWPLQPYNGFYGRINPSTVIPGVVAPASAPLQTNQRKVGATGVVERSSTAVSPGTKFRVIPAGTVITMKGWRIGQRVPAEGGANLWYVGTNGRYYHCSGFTAANTAGLPDLTPKAAPAKPATPPAPAKPVAPAIPPVVAGPPAVTSADVSTLAAFKVWLDKFLTTQKVGK